MNKKMVPIRFPENIGSLPTTPVFKHNNPDSLATVLGAHRCTTAGAQVAVTMEAAKDPSRHPQGS